MTTNANECTQGTLCTRHQQANTHEQALRLVPHRCVAFVFFGPSELVRCCASCSQVVSHAKTLSILERASYRRQRSKETGKPFLLLSVYTAADIATIVEQVTVPFVQRCNEALQHRACRVETRSTEDLPYMRCPDAYQQNQPRLKAKERRHVSLTVSVNKFACLSTDDDQPPDMQPTEQQHQVSTNLSQKITIGSLNIRRLVTGSLQSKAHDVCKFLVSKQVDICAVQGTWCDAGDCDMRGLILKERLRATGVNGYNTRKRMGGGTGFIFTESMTQNVAQLRWDSQHNE